jgi:protein O-mannosyl-transferase
MAYSPPHRVPRGLVTGICLMLLVLAVWAFLPSLRNGFVNYDDPAYVTHNPIVRAGLTWAGFCWAFQTGHASNWHPLTWVSHMADCELYGLDPAGHHRTSLLFHLANTLLVWVVLRRMTGSNWRSACVAALFGWHPLHVESVAWAAERKDVLSTFWFLLALWAYVRYAEVLGSNSQVPVQKAHSGPQLPAWSFYAACLGFFALGLMSKPMVVTLPFVLLLLDYWPLGRLAAATAERSGTPAVRLIWEKVPFFVLAAAASIVTYLVQRAGGALSSFNGLPLGSRIANALVAYTGYLRLTVWPAHLAVLYPYSRHLAAGSAIAAALALAGLSGWLLWRGRRQPYLVVGWLWFVGTLVPTIGLVQVGAQCMADRYMYIPSIGLFLLVVWGLEAALGGWRRNRWVLVATGAVALGACLACTRQQLGYWRGGESLFRRALAVTRDNYVAHNNLGSVLLSKGQVDEAIGQLREALRLMAEYPDAHNNLGAALLAKGQFDQAIAHLQAALATEPNFAHAHYNLGAALDGQGRHDEAIAQFREALRLAPGDAGAHSSLGAALFSQGQLDEAISQLEEASRLAPGDPDTLHNLGVALSKKGRLDEAISRLQEAFRLKPGFAEAYCSLGIALGKQGRPDDAISKLQEALRLNPDLAEAHCSLGVALGKNGRLDEAISHLQQALKLKPDYAEAQNNLRAALSRKAAAGAPPSASAEP